MFDHPREGIRSGAGELLPISEGKHYKKTENIHQKKRGYKNLKTLIKIFFDNSIRSNGKGRFTSLFLYFFIGIQ